MLVSPTTNALTGQGEKGMCADCDKTLKTVYMHLGLGAIGLAKLYDGQMLVAIDECEVVLSPVEPAVAAFCQAAGKGFVVTAQTTDEALIVMVNRFIARITNKREIPEQHTAQAFETMDDTTDTIEGAVLAFTNKGSGKGGN
jgi:hypothetical protein